MRIAILGRDIRPPWNEAVKNMAFELARELTTRGHTIHLITNDGSVVPPMPNLEVHSILGRGFGRAALGRVKELEASGEIDILHVQNLVIHRSLAVLLRLLRRRSRLPVVAYCCQLPALSVSHWLRVLRKDPKEALSSKLGMLAPAFATRWIVKNIDLIVASSGFVREHLSVPTDSRQIEVIYPFIRRDNLRIRLPTKNRVSGPPKLLYLGNHKVLRGEDDFLVTLAALKRKLPDIEGTAITTHPIPPRTQRLVERLGIGRSVNFLPRSIQLDVPALMEASDIYMFTGLPPIGSIDPPLTIIEALILGTQVLSYDAGGIKEIVDQDRLVKYGDTAKLAEQAFQLLQHRTEKRPRPDLLETFSSENAAKQFEKIYEGLS
jgi:glycosyltransferase involved in cell wall biosynthesis